MFMNKKKIETVYIAGLLTPRGTWSTNLAIDHEINLRKNVRAGLDVLFAGFDPFIPAFDHLFWWVMQDGEIITEAMIKRFSKTWLKRCDAVVLTPKWRGSPGTLAEIKLAEKLGIPVFETLEDLLEYVEDNEDEKN